VPVVADGIGSLKLRRVHDSKLWDLTDPSHNHGVDIPSPGRRPRECSKAKSRVCFYIYVH
jgi:hypothetical protein